MNNPLNNYVEFRLSEWTKEIEAFSAKIPFDNPSGYKDWLFREHCAGRIKLVEILENGQKLGVFAFAIYCNAGRQLYIAAAFMDSQAHNYTEFLLKYAEELAKVHKCAVVSFDTMRPGLIKKASSLGYRISKVTLLKEVT